MNLEEGTLRVIIPLIHDLLVLIYTILLIYIEHIEVTILFVI